MISVGQRMPGWVAEGWQEYARRLPPHLPLELIEVPVAGRKATGREREAEAQALADRIPERARRIAMHGAGRPWSTEVLARHLADWQQDGDPVCFLIGGAEGLHPDLLASCQARWSLGPAVFPHMLVRVLVAEQLYRASTILSGHPYHRGG
ncbi:23S rRNA (pseudouridine(1915)-N(3))-methyltransferase RlmH [Wenzhouxiangella marina]|uniref:23S rRNA (pseudouridine(1915)-N(3))-methyltransferase RlmH n=1 Tax=Wenzhouxiangella marina TaxID=1579979 RepID=UPI0017CC2FAB|nr:23S rRNA (pseudouridine(1915)-N(3))-methyltransferase RlmH [Wenzhouxiangella marina]MBB6087843.1 23S rRNA (pseudouridine1915-N3)-methyltransferase [Wenzhouxiangella marina]